MSGAYSARVLVLRKTKLGESDLIVTALDSEGHQVRAVAKGARKPGSRFCGRVEPFTVLDCLFARGRTLDVMTEAETVATHEALRRDYDSVRAASVVADFLDRVTADGDADPRLYELGVATISALETAPAEAAPTLVAAFLVKGMALIGLRPVLAGCVSCGAECEEPKAFSVSGGGVVCQKCAAGDPDAVATSPGLSSALAWLLRARLAEAATDPLAAQACREALVVLRAFVTRHIPARMRALDEYVRG